MRISIFMISMIAIGAIVHGCNTKKQSSKDSEALIEEESFLGQKPPRLIPELFAPDLVSTNHLEIEAAIAPTMEEFYFIRQKKGEAPKSHLLTFENGKLQDVEVERPSGEVFISTDNRIMYLGNAYKERTDFGWTEEKSIGALFDKYSIMRLTASSDDTYYFDERDTIGTIRYSKMVDGQREIPRKLGEQINSGEFTSHPFIAPDESYLIWDSERDSGFGGSDLYISFRQDDGSWGPAINMGKEINTEIDDTYGSVTSDGKYFFFNRVDLGESFEESEANIFWVDAQVIKRLRNK
ncbi:hypothetical protein FK220_012170 [Flavobacteriaceae bacterium TP-CH-4]|uniref:WD40-like Beta Propeller Repeat n=1 Tax=Pelagihabitans pacificus TaxID=2696054 RepID=A0A967ATH7_9FLAO|nr:PD40 domain-containing protein [Pelagihabitans pacificus]NHF60104.1 hypothetical protein [Pelagihabitans pacificus]